MAGAPTRPVDITEFEGLPDDAPHVLVVDDDQRIRNLLSKYLTNNRFRVTPAADASAARAACSERGDLVGLQGLWSRRKLAI